MDDAEHKSDSSSASKGSHRLKVLALGGLTVAAAAVSMPYSGQWAGDRGDRPEATTKLDAKRVMPKGALVLIGGTADRSGKLPEIASEIGVPEEHLQEPAGFLQKLEAQHLDALCQRCDHAGIFNAIQKTCPFKGKTVVCVTSASKENAQRNAWLDQLFFRLMGASDVVTITNRSDANKDAVAEVISDSKTAMVYFDGGDQHTLSESFNNTRAYHAVRERYINDEHFTVAGTSAGAAVMAGSGSMIKGWNEDNSAAELGSGLALLDHIIVDTHIHRTEALPRLGRLQAAVNTHPHCIGLGLDDSTGVVIRGGVATVIGAQKVWKLEPTDRDYPSEEIRKTAPSFVAGDKITLGDFASMIDFNRDRASHFAGR